MRSKSALAPTFTKAFLQVGLSLNDIKRIAEIVERRLDLIEARFSASSQVTETIRLRLQAAGK